MEDQYRILLVCRPGPQGDLWEKALSAPFIRAIRALDGEQGLRRLEKEPVQAMLCEIRPRRIDIERLLETANRMTPRPLRIVLADHPAGEEINRCLRAGIDCMESFSAPSDDFAPRLRALLQMQTVVPIEKENAESSPMDRLVGRSAAMAEMKRRIGQLASAPSAVLFTGETGTGKTLAAEVLHAVSERSGKPFIRVYCPALSRTLIESELFGHEKGAFTDAKTAHPGIFERAAGGTVLIEEVGDLPGPTQSAILRLLETGEIRRIGSSRPLRLDVRLLFATRNLSKPSPLGAAFVKVCFTESKASASICPPCASDPRILPT
jgi:two-component system response regulator AtoC